MYYEINISRLQKRASGTEQYIHFFATNERSINTMNKLNEVYSELKKAFPSPKYKLTVTRWVKNGHDISENEIHTI